jgi:predicted nucleotidyltransferase
MPQVDPISPEEIKAKIRPILLAHQVVRASVFGSVVHGDATPESDLDLLVDFGQTRKSLFDIHDLQDDLQATLGRKVDLVLFDFIKPRLKKRILASQVPVL